ncbi:MAG: metalloprotease PmbA [Pseudomonadota bacterium]
MQGLLSDPEREAQLLTGIAERLLDQAKVGGADAAEVSVSSSLGRHVAVRLGELDVLEDARDRGIGLTVYKNRASGSVSTADLSPDALDQSVAQALAIAEFTQADPAGGLADAELMADPSIHDEADPFDLWHPQQFEMGELIDRAQAMEQAGLDADEKIENSEGASVSANASLGVYANTHGFIGRARRTHYSQHCILVASDESGMQRDWDWDDQRHWTLLTDPAETGLGAARKTVRRLGARRAPTGQVPVVFAPDTALGLIRHLVSAVSGGNLYRRSSFLLDQAGSQIFPDWVQIEEQPHLAGGQRSSRFDNEGVATEAKPLIEHGVLARYVLGSYSARKLSLQTTANAGGVRNLLFQPGSDDFDALVRKMQRGLIVTEVMGQGVNLVTGDYSRGASGFWVENGEIVYPVEEITIAGNLAEMFKNLIAAGNDVETRRNIQVPSLLVDGMTVAGE